MKTLKLLFAFVLLLPAAFAGPISTLPVTASSPNSDDYLAIDGDTANKTRRILATYFAPAAATTSAISAAQAAAIAASQPHDTDLDYLASFTPTANVKSVLNAADYAAIKTLLSLVIGTNVQAYNANLTTFAGIAPSANVQSVLSAADYAAIKTLLGLVIGTNVQAYNANLTTYAGIAPTSNVQSVLSAADYAAIRTLLGLVIGTNVQAYNANLTTYAGIAPSSNVQSLLSAANYAAINTLLATLTTASKTDVLQAADYAADAGANDTYTATLSPTITAYGTGVRYRFKANTANTGAASINFNSLGAKTIKKVAGGITTDLADNDIRAGQWVEVVYDGTNMQMVSQLGNAASGSGDVVAASNNTLTGQNTTALGFEAAWTSQATGSQNYAVNKKYYITTFTTSSTAAFTGTPATGSTISVLLKACNGTATFTYPTAQRLGDPSGTSTVITPTAGDHLIRFEYVNSIWYFTDTITSTVLPNGMTATTQTALDNSTKVATTAYTDAAVKATAASSNLGNCTGTINIDWSLVPNGGMFRGVLTGNTTFTFSNGADAKTIIVDVAQTGTNTYTVTWPSMKWPAGTAPTMTTGAATSDITTIVDVNAVFKGSSVQNVK